MRNRSLVVLVVFACLVFSIPAGAQAILGSITGTVKDATGAAVPSAAVVAENLATGLTVKATSDSTGRIRFRICQLAHIRFRLKKRGSTLRRIPRCW
jgi:hypothetical protein